MDYGATVQAIRIPVAGERRDVVLGYDTVREYEEQGCYFGVTIGRVANRIGSASFTLNGKTYELTTNDAPTATMAVYLVSESACGPGWKMRTRSCSGMRVRTASPASPET